MKFLLKYLRPSGQLEKFGDTKIYYYYRTKTTLWINRIWIIITLNNFKNFNWIYNKCVGKIEK